jgi:hypothetical protein
MDGVLEVISAIARSGGPGTTTSFDVSAVEVTGGEFMAPTSRRTLGLLRDQLHGQIEAAKAYTVELNCKRKAIKRIEIWLELLFHGTPGNVLLGGVLGLSSRCARNFLAVFVRLPLGWVCLDSRASVDWNAEIRF